MPEYVTFTLANMHINELQLYETISHLEPSLFSKTVLRQHTPILCIQCLIKKAIRLILKYKTIVGYYCATR